MRVPRRDTLFAWGAVGLALAAGGFLGFRRARRPPAPPGHGVADLLVNAACRHGEVDNYFNPAKVEDADVIYNRIARSFPRFEVDEADLAGPPEADRREVFRRAREIGLLIQAACGEPDRPAHQTVMFAGLMMTTARERRESGRAALEAIGRGGGSGGH